MAQPSHLRSFNRAGRGMAGLLALAALAVTVACGGASAGANGVEGPIKVPAAVYNPPVGPGLETAILSGGCFWGVQGVFQRVKGVKSAWSGYAGGDKSTAAYEIVSTGVTGHAETVKVVFDPKQISYADILRLYFSVATDPTQLNQQYPDEGTQYRGDIFYLDATQKAVAERYIAQLNAAKVFKKPIVTRVDPFKGFYPAETYHQDYLTLHPNQPYIATFDIPKVAALKALFPTLYRADPVRAL